MLRLKERVARLESTARAKTPTERKRWFCDVRFGHTAEDVAAGFLVAGVVPGPHDVVRAVVHMPHQWTDGHTPFATLKPDQERSSCLH